MFENNIFCERIYFFRFLKKLNLFSLHLNVFMIEYTCKSVEQALRSVYIT